jgi:hypothetical protein
VEAQTSPRSEKTRNAFSAMHTSFGQFEVRVIEYSASPAMAFE